MTQNTLKIMRKGCDVMDLGFILETLFALQIYRNTIIFLILYSNGYSF